MRISDIMLLKSKYLNKSYYSTRSGKVLLNFSSSIVLKSINIVINLLMIPITLSYLDTVRYGLWAALSSFLAWFFIFDIGIGSGLRNKYTELKAKGLTREIRQYVSTAYFLFGIIALVLTVFFVFINAFINWSWVLKAPTEFSKELQTTISIVFGVLCLNFVIRLINTILTADLKNAVSDGLSVISHLMSLMGVIILSRLPNPSILKYAMVYTGSNLAVTFSASIVLYSGRYRHISPRISSINTSLWSDLVSVGVKFFFISISLNLMTNFTGILISNLLGPESVTHYTINMRYFSNASMLFIMMLQPLWSGYGDAYHKADYTWIRNMFKRLSRLWIVLLFVLVFMILVQKPIFDIWLRGKISVSYSLSALFFVYYGLYMYNAIYNPFINSTSKVKLQMYVYVSMTVLYFIMAVFFVRILHMGINGILLSLVLFHALPLAIVTPIQAHKILNGAGGIWNK